MSGEPSDVLQRLFGEILDEADSNPNFRRRLERAITGDVETSGAAGSRRRGRSGRRPPGPLDPFAVYAKGEPSLRQALGDLSVEELKDIVAEHGMDSAKLAMKWKKPEKLIDLIVSTVDTRARKGHAFRGDSDRGTTETEPEASPAPAAPAPHLSPGDGQLPEDGVGAPTSEPSGDQDLYSGGYAHEDHLHH